MNKLHLRVSEKGKPDFGFDIITNLRGIALIEAIQKATKNKKIYPNNTCNSCGESISQDTCYCDSCREYYEASSLNR